MNIRIPILAVALSLPWLSSAAPANIAGRPQAISTISTDVSDELGDIVKARLIDKLGADALWITVSVTGDTATLTGDVTKLPQATLAEQLALTVKGIRRVENKVTMGANGKSCPTRHPKEEKTASSSQKL